MTEPSLTDLVDAVTDLGRIVARQGAGLDRLLDDSRATAARSRAGADLPLLVDLLALHRQATTCAATARTKRERDAFDAFASGIERLLNGRGARLVSPAAGTAFDASSMDAVEVEPTSDPGADRTVAAVLEPGLWLEEPARTARPARVVVRKLG